MLRRCRDMLGRTAAGCGATAGDHTRRRIGHGRFARRSGRLGLDHRLDGRGRLDVGNHGLGYRLGCSLGLHSHLGDLDCLDGRDCGGRRLDHRDIDLDRRRLGRFIGGHGFLDDLDDLRYDGGGRLGRIDDGFGLRSLLRCSLLRRGLLCSGLLGGGLLDRLGLLGLFVTPEPVTLGAAGHHVGVRLGERR